MSLTIANWNRCIGLIKSNAPAYPNTQQTTGEEIRSNASRTIGTVDTFLSELDLGLSGVAGNLVTIATANSASDVVDSVMDSAIEDAVAGFGGAASGAAAGGVIALLRGAMQQADRTSDMSDYLCGTTAYVLTISRTAADAMYSSLPYVRMPEPAIPAYADQTGQFRALPSMRRHFMGGYEKARTMFNAIDVIRPPNGPRHSKFFSIQMMINAGYSGGQRADIWRVRQRLELLILRDVLGADLNTRRRELSRWARSA